MMGAIPCGCTDGKGHKANGPSHRRYLVTVFTNQAGLNLHPEAEQVSKGPKRAASTARDRLSAFKQKCSDVLTGLDIPLTIYAATGRDIFRKPRTGMWTELLHDYHLQEQDIDMRGSLFVGDAGGRIATIRAGAVAAKDFSCSDRNFASNVGVQYQTPEEFFLGEPSRDFRREFDLEKYPFDSTADQERNDIVFEKGNDLDIVLFCGPPGGGKSTFYWNYLKPMGYERVNQDILKR
jgi:bifunctional polynucleotide phosphatase/kinase